MLIGLIGTSAATTRAVLFLTKHLKFEHFQFLDHVRNLCELIYNVSFHENKDIPFSHVNITPNEVVLEFDRFLRQVEPHVFQQNLNIKGQQKIVVSDVFYLEDVQRVKELGGIIIRLREKNEPFAIAPSLCSDYVIEFTTNLEIRILEIVQQKFFC